LAAYTWIPTRGTVGSSSGGTSTAQLYVATTGNNSAIGSEAAPLATIDGARLAIASRGLVAKGPVIVNVKAGNYLNTAVTFGAADSGTVSNGVTYRSSDGLGRARLIGGTLASGWTLHSGSIYKLALSTPCYTLYENGVRAVRARLPVLAPGASFPCAFAPYFLTLGTNGSYTDLKYNSANFSPGAWTLADIRLFFYGTNTSQINWFSEHAQPTGLNTGTQVFTIGNDGLKFAAYGGVDPGARFFVEGPLELLQGPGEFCIRQDAGVWTLYYWPRTSPIASQEIIIPTQKTAVSFLGTDETTRTKYITLSGFAIEGTDFDSWYRYGTAGLIGEPYDYFDTMSQFRHGGVRMENCDHITLKWNNIHHTGFSGVFMHRYCQSNTLYQNYIHHTGTDGISVNGPVPGTGNTSQLNTFDDQKITNMGELDASANGIRLSQSASNIVRFHTISSGPRRAIWLHGSFAVPAASNYCRSNYIHHVLASSIMQDTGDAGGITISFLSSPAGGGSQVPVNTFEQNIITGCTAHASMLDAAPNGQFCDNDSSGQVFTNIQITSTQGNQFRLNSSDGPVLTNCSFLSNGAPNGSFNAGLMDTATIGVSSTFPY
jgi:hypothetical protein